MIGQLHGPCALKFGTLDILGIIQDGIVRVIDLLSKAMTCLFIKDTCHHTLKCKNRSQRYRSTENLLKKKLICFQ